MNAPACPTCGKVTDGYASFSNDNDDTPSNGDITICWYCASVNTFTDIPEDTTNPDGRLDEGRLTPVTGNELLILLTDADVLRAISAVIITKLKKATGS